MPRVRFIVTKIYYKPKNDSAPVVVPLRNSYKSGQSGWVSAWDVNIEGHWDARPWTIGDDVALQNGVRPW